MNDLRLILNRDGLNKKELEELMNYEEFHEEFLDNYREDCFDDINYS